MCRAIIQESLIPHDMFHTENALAILYMALILSNLNIYYSIPSAIVLSRSALNH